MIIERFVERNGIFVAFKEVIGGVFIESILVEDAVWSYIKSWPVH